MIGPDQMNDRGIHRIRSTLSTMEEKLLLEIEEKIKQILITELEVDPTVLTRCNSRTPLLGRGVGLDSVETLTLVAGIEKEYDIYVEDEDLTVDLFRDIRTLAEYVLGRIGGQ
jgi:acyl carrier protein